MSIETTRHQSVRLQACECYYGLSAGNGKKEPCRSLYRTNHSVAVSIFSSSKCWSELLEEFYKRILRPRSADNASCVCCMLVGRTFHSYHLHILQVFDGFLQRPAWRLRIGNCIVQPEVPNLEDKVPASMDVSSMLAVPSPAPPRERPVWHLGFRD